MLPLVGVGLLYQNGYLRQSLDPDGWQQEHTPVNDFYSLPVTPVSGANGQELIVSVMLARTEVFLKVWRIDVGRIQLYLLDSNIPQNPDPAHRQITNQLYGGDLHTRMRQEIVLGIGGLRALKAVGLNPTVFHMNEGHSAFLGVERIRVLMAEQHLSFDEALYASRAGNVFTTHTSVPAGIDLFHTGLMHEYFSDYCARAGMGLDQLLSIGRRNPEDSNEPFSMAVAALRMSAFRNAVSKLHRRVSQQLWEGLWPKLPVWEVPITSVTNGVHLPTWMHGDLAGIYDQYLQPEWPEGHTSPEIWKETAEIPNAELWEAHRRRKRRLVSFVRERALERAAARNAPAPELKRLQEVLNPETFTIGFARRFATYKRATLLFRDLARLKRILLNPKMPVQVVIAGKAHPQDIPGKSLIREIAQFSRDPELAGHVVFIEDYGMSVAAEMVQGVDLWLNTPRRGEEACGTSGMKAGINGVLNLSILDGWFDEAYEDSGGWAIGDREPHSPDRDEIHAAGLYSTLENEIVPLYYEGREQGVPVDWMNRVKKSLQYVTANFNSQRMVEEYRAQLYEPAYHAHEAMAQNQFSGPRDHVRWNNQVTERWSRVAFVEAGLGPESAILSGSSFLLRASVDLAGLSAEDVRVEAVVGRVGAHSELEETEVLTLTPLEKHGDVVLFGRDFAPLATGRFGYSLRVSPNHCDDPLNRPCNAPLKWANEDR